MMPCRLINADIVVNNNNASQTWTVEETFECANGKKAVVLTNTNPKSEYVKLCASEERLYSAGFKGYKK